MAAASPRQAIESVTRAISEGADILTAFKQEGVPLPRRSPRCLPQDAEGSVGLFFCDFEPDDVLAVACLQQRPDVAMPPVVVFACELDEKDAGGVFAKKLTLATSILGQDFAQELLVVGGDGLPAPPPPYEGAPEATLALAAERAVGRTSERGLRLEVMVMAPGRGNLAKLLKALKQRPEWPEVSKRMTVTMYSGAFNVRGSTEADIAAIADMARASGRPLQDVAHFVWTRADALRRLRDMPSILPDLESRLAVHNPYVLEAWLAFGLEFNARLVRPTSKKLWAKGATLTKEDLSNFDEATTLFKAGDVKGYCRQLVQDQSIMEKVAHYKRGTVACLANDKLDGPLCDCLIYLTLWARDFAPEAVSFEKVGAWTVDYEKGFTSLAAEGALCEAVQPMLAADAGEEAADLFAGALMSRVVAATTLSSRGPLPSVATWMMPRRAASARRSAAG